MLVQLLKDVSLPHNGGKDTAPTGPPKVGSKGEVVDLDTRQAEAYIKRGLAVAALADAPATEAKENKEAAARKTKVVGPSETKAPAGALTHDSVKADPK
jgi:hypothetical protein